MRGWSPSGSASVLLFRTNRHHLDCPRRTVAPGDGSILLKNSPMRSALHFIEHGWCDEVTHIARSVSFDYYSKSAQRDSIEGKHSFRTFKPLLNRIASGPALLSPRSTSSERNSHAITIDPSGKFSHPSPAGRGRWRRRDSGHRFQLGRLGHRRNGKRDDAEKRQLSSRIGTFSHLRRQVSAQRRRCREPDRT